MKQKIKVYVKSVKILMGESLVEELYTVKRPSVYHSMWFRPKLKKIYSYALPDDQKEIVEVVRRMSEQVCVELEVVDVGSKTIIHRLWKRLRRIKDYPVVETNRGSRLQAPFTRRQLERFISESAQRQ